MERQRRKLENGMHCAENPSRGTLYKALSRVADSWAQVILSNPATVARAVRGEKGGAEIEAPYLIHSDYCGLLRPARFPKFRIPQDPGAAKQPVRLNISSISTLEAYQQKFTRLL